MMYSCVFWCEIVDLVGFFWLLLFDPCHFFHCVRGTRTQSLIFVGCSVHYWVSCAINKRGFLRLHFVDTHVLPHFDALTHTVIRVSSAFIFQTFAEVCYSVFVKRSFFKILLNLRKAYIFKSLLKVYHRSMFVESSKAFIFQKCRRLLCHKVTLPSCVARWPLCHKVNLPRCEA